MIKLKYKRPTEKSLGHTDVYVNGVYRGYLIQCRGKHEAIGNNWCFVGKSTTYFKNRKQALEYFQQMMEE